MDSSSLFNTKEYCITENWVTREIQSEPRKGNRMVVIWEGKCGGDNVTVNWGRNKVQPIFIKDYWSIGILEEKRSPVIDKNHGIEWPQCPKSRYRAA